VKEFVIIQNKIDTFEIQYVSERDLNDIEIQNIQKAITTYLESGLHFSFIRKKILDRNKSGKLKQFASLLK